MYGELIRELMKEHHYDTAYELAKAAGVSQMGLLNILSDKVKKPNRMTLDKVGFILGGLTAGDLKGMINKKECK